MRRFITGLCLMVGFFGQTAAVLAAEPAQVDELYHAAVEFYRDGNLIHSEELTGAGTQLAELGVPEAGPLDTYRFTTVIQARSHGTTASSDDPVSLYAGSGAFTAALQAAQRLTVNDVDLVVFHPGADTCRVRAWWTYYSVIGGSLVLDETQPVTREPRTAEIVLNTEATPFYDDGSARQYTKILELIRTPELPPLQTAAAGRPDVPAAIEPLMDIRIPGITEYASNDRRYPFVPDTRPLALYADRIVRYDQSVLEDRTLYFVTLAFSRGDDDILVNSFSVMEKPLPSLFSSIYWYTAEELNPGWPQTGDGGSPATINYLVRLRSQESGKLLSSGRCLEDLPEQLNHSLHYFSFGGLRFEVFHPGAEQVEASVSVQLIPGHLISQGPGELVPLLTSQPPGEIVNLGSTVVELATPDPGVIDLPAGVDAADLGVLASIKVMKVVEGE